MSKPKIRDNAYWLSRLEREYPAIHARFLAGDIPSVRAACAEAGLIHLPTRVDSLKREWNGASPAERKDFYRWLKSKLPPRPVMSAPSAVLTGTDGYLLSSVIKRIETIMARPGPFGPGKALHGRIMSAMGFARSSTHLANALQRRGKPRQVFLDRLQEWLVETEKD